MYLLSIDAGGTAVKYGVIDEKGHIYRKGSFPTPKSSLEELLSELRRVQEELGVDYELAGVAASFPGAVDELAGVIHNISAIPYIHEVPLKERLESVLGLPVTMENDANCAALGENWLGAAKGASEVVFLVCGTGVGGALLSSGRVHTGSHFLGGEIGFMLLDEEGHTINERGSVGGLVRRLEERKGLPEGSLDGQKAFELAEGGDEAARAEIAVMYRALAQGIINVQYVYDPELFVLGGAISSRPDFVPSVRQEVARLMELVPMVKMEPVIQAAEHGNDANLLGAVFHFLHSF